MCAQRFYQVIDRETGRVGVGENARGEGAQPAVVLARGVGLCGRGPNERSNAAPGLDDAGALELGIDTGDSVGVDAKVDGQLADGRPLVARAQAASGDGRAQPAFELRVDGCRVAGVDGDDAHLSAYASALVQVRQARRQAACAERVAHTDFMRSGRVYNPPL